MQRSIIAFGALALSTALLVSGFSAGRASGQVLASPLPLPTLMTPMPLPTLMTPMPVPTEGTPMPAPSASANPTASP